VLEQKNMCWSKIECPPPKRPPSRCPSRLFTIWKSTTLRAQWLSKIDAIEGRLHAFSASFCDFLTTFLHRKISKHLPSCCRQLRRSMQVMGEP